MANYSLVIDSKFRPFSYNDFLAPVQAATTEHKALETVYGELGAQSAAWEERLQNAPQAKQYYDEFQQTLQDVTNDLAENGLTMSSRRKALAAREQYANNIVPLEEAWQRQQADIDRQQKSQDKNNGRNIYNYDARTQSLDYYLDPNAKGFVSANLNDITNTGIAGGKALSERYIKTEEGRRFDNYYYSLVKETGMNPQTAMKVLAEMKDENTGDYKFPEFRKFVQDAKTSFGVDANNNAYGYSDLDLSRAEAALFEGINLGITYKENEQLYQNPEALAALKARYSKADEEKYPEYNVAPGIKLENTRRVAPGFDDYNYEDYDNLTITKTEDGKYIYTYPEKQQEEAERNSIVGRVIQSADNAESLHKKLIDQRKNYKLSGAIAAASSNFLKEEEQKEAINTIQKILKDDLGLKIDNNTSKEELIDLGSAIINPLVADEEFRRLKKLDKTKEQKAKEFAANFKAYSDDENTRFYIGHQMMKAYQVPTNVYEDAPFKSSQYEDAKKKIAYMSVGKSEGLLFEMDKDGRKGDPIDSDEAREFILKEDTSIGLQTYNDAIHFVAKDSEGNTYILGGKEATERAKYLTDLNVLLGDFNPKTSSGVTVATNSKTIDIDKASDEELLEFSQRKGVLKERRGFKTAIITNKDKGDAVRIVYTPEGGIYRQTLKDEFSGGNNRARQIKKVKDAALNYLVKTYAPKGEQ